MQTIRDEGFGANGVRPAPTFVVEASMPLQESPKWYAAYTRSRHEKHVQKHCQGACIESFLPVYQAVNRWNDRSARVEMPLFPCYIFVRITSNRRLAVLQIPGVSCLVGFGGQPMALREEEIERLRKGLATGVRAIPHPYLVAGRRVRIRGGPLAGFEGVLVRRKGNLRVVLSIDLLRRSIALDANIADLEPVLTPTAARRENITAT